MSEPKFPARLKTIPTKLKQLAEKRARLAGLVELSLASDKPYIDELDALLEKLSLLEEKLEISALQRNEINTALSALDEEIVKLSPKTDPSQIQAIFGWKEETVFSTR